MTTTHTLCNHIRSWETPSHSEISQVFVVLASYIEHAPTGLTDKCRKAVVGGIDEITEMIIQDLANQQAEQAWLEGVKA